MKLSHTQYRFTPDAGLIKKPVKCGVCGQKMNMTANLHGARSFVQALGGVVEYYDEFLCPHSSEAWHEKVVDIRDEAKRTASDKLAKMLLDEADELVSKSL